MWVFWWVLYLVGGLIGFYVLIVLPAVLFYSAVFPQKCLACHKTTLKYLKFVRQDSSKPAATEFIPRAYYECKECRATFKLERGDWIAVSKEEVDQMIR